MPWSRDEPDPLRAKRRALAEQERLLAERMSQLTQELRQAPEPAAKKLVEPPVWRMDEDGLIRPAPEMSSIRRRDLARQRRRDKILFFLFIGLLLVASAIFVWVYQTHLRTVD